jgi:hypothetical protein
MEDSFEEADYVDKSRFSFYVHDVFRGRFSSGRKRRDKKNQGLWQTALGR